jgi:hypothetical protein
MFPKTDHAVGRGCPGTRNDPGKRRIGMWLANDRVPYRLGATRYIVSSLDVRI